MRRKVQMQRSRITARDRIRYISENNGADVLRYLDASSEGLSEDDVENSRRKYGVNRITGAKKDSIAKRLFVSFINPFTTILLVLSAVSYFTDVVLAAPGEKSFSKMNIIFVMVFVSGLMRFIQETGAGNAAQKLNDMIITTACVERSPHRIAEIPISEIVVGDIVYLSAGDMIPADVRILAAKDLFVSQSALTGESEPVEKFPTYDIMADTSYDMLAARNIAYLGTNVISGTATAVAAAVGDQTVLGQTAKYLAAPQAETSFEHGIRSVSGILIKFMAFMVPVVFILNGMTKHNWPSAFLFAVSIAVGLTPVMLPMIVTTCLAKGSVSMSKKDVIVKNINSIQSLGSMDVLCTDKTGTLTQNKVILEYRLGLTGETDRSVLQHAFLNSYYQTGLKNLMDVAIIDRAKELEMSDVDFSGIENDYKKVDELPFDFERRRMSVVVSDSQGAAQMITKGAIEEMLNISSRALLGGRSFVMSDSIREMIMKKVNELSDDGMRVLGLALKTGLSPDGSYSVADESNMTLIGYLAFLDPPKETARTAIRALTSAGVNVKVLTGDNEAVTAYICRQVGIPVNKILFGSDIADMSDTKLSKECERTNIFVKLSPSEKSRIVSTLRSCGHRVGFLGDGINDAAAIKMSDVGISVDTAVDIAKESAGIILLKKDLMVLKTGIIEGRKIYANMSNYIKMTASSNYGNMFSVLAASAFLPFLPMLSIHLLILSMIYDISCIALPWDNVDPEFLKKPRDWNASSLEKFMLWIGPTSSVFDITTFLILYFFICPHICGGTYAALDASGKLLFASIFQTGWFVESMWSQTLVIHMIRTPKVPFLQSHASWQVTLLTSAGILLLTVIPFTGIGRAISLQPLPAIFFACLACILAGYMVLVTFVKNLFVRRCRER